MTVAAAVLLLVAVHQQVVVLAEVADHDVVSSAVSSADVVVGLGLAAIAQHQLHQLLSAMQLHLLAVILATLVAEPVEADDVDARDAHSVVDAEVAAVQHSVAAVQSLLAVVQWLVSVVQSLLVALAADVVTVLVLAVLLVLADAAAAVLPWQLQSSTQHQFEPSLLRFRPCLCRLLRQTLLHRLQVTGSLPTQHLYRRSQLRLHQQIRTRTSLHDCVMCTQAVPRLETQLQACLETFASTNPLLLTI